MILFGYKSKFNSILRGLSAIAIGLVLLFGTGRGEGASAVEIVVKIIAAFLMSSISVKNTWRTGSSRL